MPILSHTPKPGYKFLVLSNLKINPCSKAIWGGVWYQNSSLWELENNWAFLGKILVWELKGNLTLLEENNQTAIKQPQSLWCWRLGIPKSRLLNNSCHKHCLPKGTKDCRLCFEETCAILLSILFIILKAILVCVWLIFWLSFFILDHHCKTMPILDFTFLTYWSYWFFHKKVPLIRTSRSSTALPWRPSWASASWCPLWSSPAASGSWRRSWQRVGSDPDRRQGCWEKKI